MRDKYRIGIDLGGTKIEALLLDREGRERYRQRCATPAHSYEGIVSAVCELIQDAEGRLPGAESCTVGVGIPGSMNDTTLLVQNANTTCLNGRPLQKDLESRLGRPVGVDNDANCFTLAESLAGAGRGCEMVFGVIMGTGCGGGLCIDGRVRRGPNAVAGEWGHYAVDPGGRPCYCGNRGCVETKISGGGVEASFYDRTKTHRTMDEIVTGFRNQDLHCVSAFETFIDDFGRCLGGLISILDPDRVVLGGGLSNIDELYSLGIERVRRYVFHREPSTPIVKNSLGDSAGVFGAAWIGRSG